MLNRVSAKTQTCFSLLMKGKDPEGSLFNILDLSKLALEDAANETEGSPPHRTGHDSWARWAWWDDLFSVSSSWISWLFLSSHSLFFLVINPRTSSDICRMALFSWSQSISGEPYWGTLVGSQGTPWSSTVPFCSLHQTLWSGSHTLHTVLCSAPYISLGAVWGWILCLWCPWWLWTLTGFLINGLQWWWLPICLGAHKQGFFLRWRAELSPDSWSNLTFPSWFCTR